MDSLTECRLRQMKLLKLLKALETDVLLADIHDDTAPET